MARMFNMHSKTEGAGNLPYMKRLLLVFFTNDNCNKKPKRNNHAIVHSKYLWHGSKTIAEMVCRKGGFFSLQRKNGMDGDNGDDEGDDMACTRWCD